MSWPRIFGYKQIWEVFMNTTPGAPGEESRYPHNFPSRTELRYYPQIPSLGVKITKGIGDIPYGIGDIPYFNAQDLFGANIGTSKIFKPLVKLSSEP